MRWCAAGMVEAGKQFRRVNGHLYLASLRTGLEREAAETVGPTCHDDLVFMWSDRPRARRSPARVADLIAAFGARRVRLGLAAAAIPVTAAGRDGGRGQRRCQDQEHSAPRARVPGPSRPVAAPSAGSLAGDNHAGMLSLYSVTVKVQGRVVAAPALSWRTSARWAPGRGTGRTGLAAGGELTARTQPAVPATVEEVHDEPHCHPYDEADPDGSRQVEHEVEGDEDGDDWDKRHERTPERPVQLRTLAAQDDDPAGRPYLGPCPRHRHPVLAAVGRVRAVGRQLGHLHLRR